MSGTPAPEHDNSLGSYLRAHREQVHPSRHGLAPGAGRRVAGLRREEVAALAGVSVHYYVRLEQGRDRHPSRSVLDALARVFGLDDQGRAHLTKLAEPDHVGGDGAPPVEAVRPTVAALMGQWTDQAAWARHEARDKPSGHQRFHTATAGTIDLLYEPFVVAGSAGQILYVFFAAPGTHDAQALRDLSKQAARST